MKDIISTITIKELEQITFRALQDSFSQMMAETLVEIDESIATGRKKEERLEELIAQLSQYPEALGDYRKKLKNKGIDTTGFRPVGKPITAALKGLRGIKKGEKYCLTKGYKLGSVVKLRTENNTK